MDIELQDNNSPNSSQNNDSALLDMQQKYIKYREEEKDDDRQENLNKNIEKIDKEEDNIDNQGMNRERQQIEYSNNQIQEERTEKKYRKRGRKRLNRGKKIKYEEEVCNLFIDLIDVINQCYTENGLPKDAININELEPKKYNEQEKYQKNKSYTSTRLKRKPTQKYNQQKQPQKLKQLKTKRSILKKNSTINNISDQQKVNSKEPQNFGLSVQQILSRKLLQQKNLEKKSVFQNYAVVMKYTFHSQIDQQEDVQKKLQRQKAEAMRKLSIQKCLEVSFQPVIDKVPQNQK